MIIRAAIVLLLVLNLGVAAWWVLHDAPPPAKVQQPAGVPRLQLLAESGPVAEAPPSRTDAPAIAMPPPCQGPAGEGASWRVYVSGLDSAEAAQAMADRIGAAGFSDYLVMREGEGERTIALGLFTALDGAQRRVDALQGAGFPARCARIAPSTPA